MDKLSFGGWLWNIPNYTLTYQKEDYEIDLESITCSSQMLDWIFQLKTKEWADENVMFDLLTAFNKIFWPQNSLCSFGSDKHIKPKDVISKNLNCAKE